MFIKLNDTRYNFDKITEYYMSGDILVLIQESPVGNDFYDLYPFKDESKEVNEKACQYLDRILDIIDGDFHVQKFRQQ